MGPDHMRAARAATLLADLGNPAALEGLRGLLNGPYDGVSRSVAAGLVQTRNRAAVELARPLLDSPYEEMSTDALMALGRLGDPQAQAGLQRIVDGTDSHPHETVALASWYLIKTQHQQELAAPRLAQAFH
jgi:HEAT repeat protein